MLQPSSITALLTQLLSSDSHHGSEIVKPHTALLSLVDTQELYAFATRRRESVPDSIGPSTVQAVLADTAAAAGSSRPREPLRHLSSLSLDERVTCLSAIAVASWRQAVGHTTTTKTKDGRRSIALPGTKVSIAVSQHAVAGLPSTTDSGGKSIMSHDLVPLLLECELGRLLVMPIVPAVPQMSASRAELAAANADYSHDDAAFTDSHKPFMLLTLNADLDTDAAAAAAAPVAAPAQVARLRSGGTTPTSPSSEATVTPLRSSPMSEHFPPDSSQQGSVPDSGGSEDVAAVAAKEQAVWSGMFGQAKAFARIIAPSLAKCGVGVVHHDDDDRPPPPPTVDDRPSGHTSEDDVDQP